LRIYPDYVQAHSDLANVLASLGWFDEAIAHYQRALNIRPDFAAAHNNLAGALFGCGRIDEAIAEYRMALKIRPDYAGARENLGNVLAGSGRFDEAIVEFQKALEIKPDFTQVRRSLGMAISRRDGILSGLIRQREWLLAHPDDAARLNDFAWLRATSPNASVRDGAEAVELAQRAVKLSGGRDPAILGTLAAAYAEAGRFADAVETARTAVDLATRQDKPALAESIKTKIPLYEARTPFRETWHSSALRSEQP
jgi:tetratricopeptide (TPR) repeat protein